MKIFLSILLFFLTSTSFADFNGGSIDLKKFRALAQAELSAAHLPTDGQILFQDGVREKMSGEGADLAALFYVSGVTFLKSYSVAYELPLNGKPGALRLVGLEPSNRIEMSNGAMTRFPTDFTEAKVAEIVTAIQAKFPNVKINQIGVALSFYTKDLQYIGDVEAALDEARVAYQAVIIPNQYISMLTEVYGSLQGLGGDGVVNLDNLRDVLPGYLQSGTAFETSASVIPQTLSPE